MECVDQLLDVLVKERVVGDRVHPVVVLGGIGQLTMNQEVGDLEEGGAFGQLLDGIAAVTENAPLPVDKGDRASAARRVQEGRVIAEQTGTRPVACDLLQ